MRDKWESSKVLRGYISPHIHVVYNNAVPGGDKLHSNEIGSVEYIQSISSHQIPPHYVSSLKLTETFLRCYGYRLI